MLVCDRRVFFFFFFIELLGSFSWWRVCEAVVHMNGDGCIFLSHVLGGRVRMDLVV